MQQQKYTKDVQRGLAQRNTDGAHHSRKESYLTLFSFFTKNTVACLTRDGRGLLCVYSVSSRG